MKVIIRIGIDFHGLFITDCQLTLSGANYLINQGFCNCYIRKKKRNVVVQIYCNGSPKHASIALSTPLYSKLILFVAS